MARVQLTIPEEDRDRFKRQARREGMTLGAWLRAAALQRLEARQPAERFASPDDLGRFFGECDARRGSGAEPDWEEYTRAMEDARRGGLTEV